MLISFANAKMQKSCNKDKQRPPFGAKTYSDICPQALSVPRSEQFSESEARRKPCERLRGTDNVQGQMSELLLRQMEAIVFTTLKVFFATRVVLKIGEYSSV